MTTLSPTVAPDVFIASTFISSPLARVLHELFAAHDSQALLFIVVTHAVVEFTFVTIPSSVAKILTHAGKQSRKHPIIVVPTYPSEIRFAPHWYEFHRAGGASERLKARNKIMFFVFSCFRDKFLFMFKIYQG